MSDSCSGDQAVSLYEIWWKAVKDETLIDRVTFMEEAEKWDACPVVSEDGIVAIVMQKGNEVHFLKTGDHQFTRSLIRSVLRIGMVTKVLATDSINRDFVRRMGFSYVGNDGEYCHYKIERLRHG